MFVCLFFGLQFSPAVFWCVRHFSSLFNIISSFFIFFHAPDDMKNDMFHAPNEMKTTFFIIFHLFSSFFHLCYFCLFLFVCFLYYEHRLYPARNCPGHSSHCCDPNSCFCQILLKWTKIRVHMLLPRNLAPGQHPADQRLKHCVSVGV